MSDISSTTQDSNGIYHLLSSNILSAQFVDVSSSTFSNPNRYFTGYAADGFYYSAGSADPTVDNFKASWAEEGEHEAATTNRGTLDRFPDRIFVVATDQEVVLVDADDLTVWMRFTKSSSEITSATGPALGGTEATIVSANFNEGLLTVATTSGVRLVNFVEDHSRYITAEVVYRGESLSGRNSETFHTISEFQESEPLLSAAWEVTSGGTTYEYDDSDSLELFLPLNSTAVGDLSDNEFTLILDQSNGGTADPTVATDSPFSGFTTAPTTCLEFINDEDQTSDWTGGFAYIEDSTRLSPQPSGVDSSFSLSMWIKPDPDIGSWGPGRSEPSRLCSKRIKGANMQARAGVSVDHVEFTLKLLQGGDIILHLYKEDDATEGAYVYTRTYIAINSASYGRAVPHPSANVWTHIGVSYEGGTGFTGGYGDSGVKSGVRFYINGEEVTNAFAEAAGWAPGSNSNYTVKSFGGAWTYMGNTPAPFIIGNSGKDSGAGNNSNRGQFFDGKMAHFGFWRSKLSSEAFKAIYLSASQGVLLGDETPPFILDSRCKTLATTHWNGKTGIAVGHPKGFSVLTKENQTYPVVKKHSFRDTFGATWNIGTTSTDMTIMSVPGVTDLDDKGWDVGDTVYGDGMSEDSTIQAVYGGATPRIVVFPAFTITASGTEITVERPVHRLLLDSGMLYLTHGLRKVTRDRDSWHDASVGSLNAFTAVEATVSLSDVGSINDATLLNEDLYIGTDLGVIKIDDSLFDTEYQGAPLIYSTSEGSGLYPVIQGAADNCTAVGADPETGHLLVANDDGSSPTVTEIDLSIHQAFQFFDSNSTPAVEDPVSVIMTYRNPNGPPDVEVD